MTWKIILLCEVSSSVLGARFPVEETYADDRRILQGFNIPNFIVRLSSSIGGCTLPEGMCRRHPPEGDMAMPTADPFGTLERMADPYGRGLLVFLCV